MKTKIVALTLLITSMASIGKAQQCNTKVVQQNYVAQQGHVALVNGAVSLRGGQYVATGYAIPVGVPVATYAPYWYSSAEFARGTHPAIEPRQQPQAAKAMAEKPADAQVIDRHDSDLAAVANNCAKCHSGDNPKGGLSLDNLATLTESQRLKAISLVMAGKMPKGKKDDMKPEDIASILRVMAGSEKEPGPSE